MEKLPSLPGYDKVVKRRVELQAAKKIGHPIVETIFKGKHTDKDIKSLFKEIEYSGSHSKTHPEAANHLKRKQKNLDEKIKELSELSKSTWKLDPLKNKNAYADLDRKATRITHMIAEFKQSIKMADEMVAEYKKVLADPESVYNQRLKAKK